MAKALKVGLAGLGTVGGGVLALLAQNAALVTKRAARPVVVSAVSARDRHRNRGVDLSALAWEDNAVDLAGRADVDVVVELIGGSDGPALALAKATISAGKAFVSANKAMLAHHGLELASRAEAAQVALKFEAAVAGGIPVIKGMREGLAANELTAVYGILNGTCNYILSTMERNGSTFAQVLGEAQALGYAEADPSFDVDGIDAAHKLAILTALGFGTKPNLEGVGIEGIRQIDSADIDYARSLGYRIKLVGAARRVGEAVTQRVAPALVPHAHPLASVMDSLNAVVAEGNFVGRMLFQGRGAGAGPTASAVVADLIDVARGEWGPAFGTPASDLVSVPAIPLAPTIGRFYMRLTVADRPGVLAEVTATLRDVNVSIESVIQRGQDPLTGGVYLVLTTHAVVENALREAAAHFSRLESVLAPPVVLQIMDL
jgi:homoserine dehydrogenase